MVVRAGRDGDGGVRQGQLLERDQRDAVHAVRRWIGCTPEENEAVWRQLNPVDHPPNTSVLLFHGEHDEDVPLEQSETYARVMKAKGADVQRVWLPGDHYDIIDVASDDWLVQLNTVLDWL